MRWKCILEMHVFRNMPLASVFGFSRPETGGKSVVDRDKAHVVSAENFHCVFHILYHAGVGGTVKKSAAFVIVNVVPDIG